VSKDVISESKGFVIVIAMRMYKTVEVEEGGPAIHVCMEQEFERGGTGEGRYVEWVPSRDTVSKI
jgi:hypothetical protein